MSEIATLPQGMANLTNQQVNSLRVTGYAGRNKWETVCEKCGSVTVKPHIALVSGSAKCRFDACSLNRLEPTKVSKWEQWLNAPEPEKQPEPTPVPVTPAPEHVSDEYRRYRRHAVINGWAQVISWQEWQEAGERGREWLLQKVNEEK